MKLKTMTSAIAVLAMTALPALAEEAPAVAEAATKTQTPFEVACIAFAAASTMAISVLGAGAAVGRIGSAALGAAAEKPELLSKSLTLVALAEGLSVLGFVISIMLVIKIV